MTLTAHRPSPDQSEPTEAPAVRSRSFDEKDGHSVSYSQPRDAETCLNGASLSPRTWALVACGTLGGLLFTTVYVVEGATRVGYNAWGQPISDLSLGAGGWVQRVNFAVFGILILASAFGWRGALRSGRAARAYPVARGIAGLGLVMDGLFSIDRPGEAPSVAGHIHNIFAFVAITALAVGCFVLARRLAVEAQWRRWAAPSLIVGVLVIVFIGAFGAMGAHGGVAGLMERLSGGVESLFMLGVVGRLMLQARTSSARRH